MNIDDEAKLYTLAGAILKQIGGKIAKGDFNLATITKPIMLTHPISLSECLTWYFTF